MKRLVLSLRDTKAEVFLPPFYVPTVGVAYRQLQDELRRPESELAKHPDDYVVYEVGVWDDVTGSFESDVGLLGPPNRPVSVRSLVEGENS